MIDITHIVISIFIWPTKRFDKLNGVDEDGYDNLRDQVVEVISDVSSNSGKVRYSGSNWSAKLAVQSEEIIAIGQKAKIVSCQGNTPFITPLLEPA